MKWKFCLLLTPLLFIQLVAGRTGSAACPPPLTAQEKARQAIDHFWKVFQSNDYAHVDDIIGHLTVAQAESPRDATVAFLLGSSHLWKFQERGRAKRSAASLAAHAHLAVHYLKIVKVLDPHRRTVDVFLDFAKANVALLQGDKALLEESFEGIRKDARQDPAFNGFVQGWVFSALMSEKDCLYHEAIDGYLATFDKCAGFRVPRSLPRLGPVLFFYLKVRARKDPVCYNTDLAPHNLEATLMGLGDTYVKSGNLVKARMAYGSVKRAPSYASWVYKNEVECRLANLESLKVKFRAETGRLDVHEPAMFFQSAYACTACHAK